MQILIKFIMNFCVLFLATDAVGHLSLYLPISEKTQPKQTKKILLDSLYFIFTLAVAVMVFSALIFALMGISSIDLQIAAGILLFVFSIYTLLNKGKEVVTDLESKSIPVIAQFIVNPVFLIVVLALASINGFITTMISLTINLFLMMYIFINCSRVHSWIGISGIKITSKIFKIILCAYAVMLVRQALGMLIGS